MTIKEPGVGAPRGTGGVAVAWYLGFVPVLPELREEAQRVVQRKA